MALRYKFKAHISRKMNLKAPNPLFINELGNIELELKSSGIRFPTYDGTQSSLDAISDYAESCSRLCLISGIRFPDSLLAAYGMDEATFKHYRDIRFQYFSHRIGFEEKKMLFRTKSVLNVVYYFKFLEVSCIIDSLFTKEQKLRRSHSYNALSIE